MSKIPCPFDWQPKYFRERGWHKDFKAWALITWAFSRCSPNTHKFYYINKEIELEPFEFIFGRDKCSEETGLSPREVRTQLKKLLDHKFIEKSTSKTTSKYTVYRWVLSQFNENIDQQKDPAATSKRPASDHKQEAIYAIDAKESSSNAEIVPIHEAWKFDPSLRPQCMEIISHSIHYQTCNTTDAELSDQDFAAAALSFFLGQKFGFEDTDLRTLRDREEFDLETVVLGTYKLTIKKNQFTKKNKKLENPMGLLIDICRHDNLRNLRLHSESEDWEGCDEELKKMLAN